MCLSCVSVIGDKDVCLSVAVSPVYVYRGDFLLWMLTLFPLSLALPYSNIHSFKKTHTLFVLLECKPDR